MAKARQSCSIKAVLSGKEGRHTDPVLANCPVLTNSVSPQRYAEVEGTPGYQEKENLAAEIT